VTAAIASMTAPAFLFEQRFHWQSAMKTLSFWQRMKEGLLSHTRWVFYIPTFIFWIKLMIKRKWKDCDESTVSKKGEARAMPKPNPSLWSVSKRVQTWR